MHYVFSIITRCNNTYQWILFFQPYHFLFTILKIVFFKYANSFVLKYAPTNIKLGTITTISIRRTKFKIVFSISHVLQIKRLTIYATTTTIKFPQSCLKYKNGLTLNKSLYTIMGLIIVLIKPLHNRSYVYCPAILFYLS